MSVIQWEKQEAVAVITMNHGENRQNPPFLQEFLATLDAIEKDPECAAVVITSGDAKYWSLGIDLGWLGNAMAQNKLDLVRTFLHDLNRFFTRLLLYPLPVIASLNGHAFGDGAIIACACDFRFMKADRGFFCFPEVDLGIPFLPGMLAILKKTIPPAPLQEWILTGRKIGADELAVQQVIHKACPDAETLLAETLAYARTFRKPRPVFGELKRRLHQSILSVMEQEDPGYIDALRLRA